MTPNELQKLFDADFSHKPAGADIEWNRAHLQYLDQSRTQTLVRLQELKLGLRDNTTPLEVSLVRRVIDRLAVIYDRPPTRWLTRDRKRIDELGDEARNLTEVLTRAQYDLAWRQADRLRALMRQVVIRFYPSDPAGSVVLRIFAPYQVRRMPSKTAPNSLDADSMFALQIGEREWEVWQKTGDGWICQWMDERGTLLPEQPYGSNGDRSPYSVLPAQVVYDDYSGGLTWLPPRESRTAWQDAINAQANDLWNLIVLQAHSQLAAKTDTPASELPRSMGPDNMMVFPRDADVSVLDNNPKINAVLDVLNNSIRLWTLSEDLPTAEFDDAKQVVTGAALKVASRALLARRSAQLQLVPNDELSAFRRLRAVHNLHTAQGSPGWDLAPIAEDLGLEVEIAELEIATDEREQLEAGARSIALGTASVIDLLQTQYGLSRTAAIARYERIQADHEAYPVEAKISTPERTTTVPMDAQDGRSHVQMPSSEIVAPNT